MPRLIREPEVHLGEVHQQAERAVTTPDGRTSVGYTRQLFDLQQRTARPLEALSRLPFASGMLIEGLALPGVRGRVKSISGADLVLTDPAHAVLFAPYNASKPARGSVVLAAEGEGYGARGATTIVRVDRVNGVLTAGANWEDEIPGIGVGNLLFENNEFLPPERVLDAHGRLLHYRGASVVSIAASFPRGGASGCLALRASPQPAEIVWLGATNNGRHVQLTSRFATVCDLWIF